jgi:iron complex transport system substrate-binding protein
VLAVAALGTASGAHAGTGVPGPDAERAAVYLESRQQPDGGFAEPGGRSDPTLTAWVVLALTAAGRDVAVLDQDGATPATYLAGLSPPEAATDLELRVLAHAALGLPTEALAGRLEAATGRGGRIGPAVNSTAWGVLALAAAGRPVPAAVRSYLARSQHRSGGFPWVRGTAPDSNDTAAAVQALVAAGLDPGSARLDRALGYLRSLRRADGGFPLERGRPSDAQSTGWTLQALAALGRRPGAATLRFLARLQRSDGSFRYQARRGLTPVWVTAQVLPGLLARPFPL